jgi:hypothetical protein
LSLVFTRNATARARKLAIVTKDTGLMLERVDDLSSEIHSGVIGLASDESIFSQRGKHLLNLRSLSGAALFAVPLMLAPLNAQSSGNNSMGDPEFSGFF